MEATTTAVAAFNSTFGRAAAEGRLTFEGFTLVTVEAAEDGTVEAFDGTRGEFSNGWEFDSLAEFCEEVGVEFDAE